MKSVVIIIDGKPTRVAEDWVWEDCDGKGGRKTVEDFVQQKGHPLTLASGPEFLRHSLAPTYAIDNRGTDFSHAECAPGSMAAPEEIIRDISS